VPVGAKPLRSPVGSPRPIANLLDVSPVRPMVRTINGESRIT